ESARIGDPVNTIRREGGSNYPHWPAAFHEYVPQIERGRDASARGIDKLIETMRRPAFPLRGQSREVCRAECDLKQRENSRAKRGETTRADFEIRERKRDRERGERQREKTSRHIHVELKS